PADGREPDECRAEVSGGRHERRGESRRARAEKTDDPLKHLTKGGGPCLAAEASLPVWTRSRLLDRHEGVEVDPRAGRSRVMGTEHRDFQAVGHVRIEP